MNLRLYLFTLICLLVIGCKMNDPENNLIGYWDIDKFTMRGIDTTPISRTIQYMVIRDLF
jgi:hypothetical protein